MKVRMIIVGILLLAIVGCSSGGGDGGTNPNALTASNLRGTYDLDVARSVFVDVDDSDLDALSAVLEVTGNTVTLTLTGTLTGTFTITGDSITFTETDGNIETFQATFSDNGATLTIIDDEGDMLVFTRQTGNATTNDLTVANLQGTYTLDVTNSLLEDGITSGTLEVDGDTLAFTGTVVSTGTFAISGNTLTITDADGGVTLFQATLSNTGTTLSLIEEDSDTLVYDKR